RIITAVEKAAAIMATAAGREKE
ncbi:MAG: hypothetical protein PWQ18_950, partial [Clostridia bacterium]|nr:hypothetical protein [Clostridia bacterium]